VVVVGACSAGSTELQSSIKETQVSIRLERDVVNMPELMAWANVAVSAGGSTCWELAFMGLPSVILVLADNQKPIAEGLDRAGVAVNLGWNGQISAERLAGTLIKLASSLDLRQRMSYRGQLLIDGNGSRRVVEILQVKPDPASA
jgi:spore coat polysaccharide biosynthesis predicted glycosyltransferase SpsG